ncbi:MAG: hypothetical protein HOJ57_08315 [Lentisphaerae bacterium]|nr:hypothetical protein [Lentisphaerota bacterium]
MSGSPAIQHRFGGMGGLFLYPERGELVVDVQRWKRTSKDRDTHLRAVLFAPDRSVLHDVLLPGPGDGKPGSQRVRLTTTVRHLGVYGLVITSPEDRYGEYTHWGFRTNCPKYIIETSRGHRDRRHEEPIVLANPDVAGDLCFLPRTKAFRIALHGLRAAEERITLADAKGRVLATLKPNAKGKAFHDVPASEARGDVPWTLHFPKFKTVAEIDGVTRWEDDDLYRNMALWTPNAESWFPLPENRWILQPYQQRVHAAPDEAGTVTFTVHNNETVEKVIDLALEFDDTPWSATVSESAVRVPPRQSVQVTLSYRMPMTGNSWACRLRATPRKSPEFTTYSSFNLAAKDVPADGTVKMPIALKPYVHENKQYGYIREYPVDQQMYFDSSHRPYVLGSRGIHAFRDGAWSITPFPEAEGQGEAEAVRPTISKIAFDRKDNLYTVVKVDKRLSLLRSKDQGTTSDLTPLPSGGSFDIEQFSGHNVPAGPPPLIRVVRTKKDPKLIWRSLNDLSLIIPAERADGSIDVGKPILISRKCIGLCSHSGIPSFVVSRDQKVHVAWGEATDPAAKAPGVPTYVATYDRETGVLGEPALIGYGPPANDCHNSPCITMDSKGYLHVLVGTHGRTFKYARSLKPNDAYGGWTETEDVGKKLSQTYVGLVCDKDDVLHLVFRLWRHDGKYQPHGGYATLAHMTKSPEQPWSQPRVLVAAAFANYSIFYHRLTIDHRGRPVLSYDYWSTYWFYRNDRRQRQRGLLLSDDGGVTWKLATNNDLR